VTGDQLLEVSNTISALKREHYGKGPEQARAYLNEDLLVVMMRGGMTRVERTLIDAGDEEVVRAVRLRFQALMTDRFTSTVERISGRPVLTYHSQVLFSPDVVVELFLLGE
jgi:uncharacterized protein YbcI